MVGHDLDVVSGIRGSSVICFAVCSVQRNESGGLAKSLHKLRVASNIEHMGHDDLKASFKDVFVADARGRL